MAILLDSNTRVVIQGYGFQGSFHAAKMKAYGTKVVGGITPGKGGTEVDGTPIFDTVKEAVAGTNATASVIFIPKQAAKAAAFEALDAGIKLLIIITEGIPKLDTMAVVDRARKKGVVMIGPNCPGMITPGEAKAGIIPSNIVTKGNIGVVSRSGTLTYEVIYQLTRSGIGQTSCIGIGGDPVKATNFIEVLRMFQEDKETRKIVMIGEIGGSSEEDAAAFIKKNVSKPVVGFIAGKTAKEGKQMGHAGAIIQGNVGTAAGKVQALTNAGVRVANRISEMPTLLK